MLDSCAELAKIVRSLPLVESCDPVRNGAIRMSTPFRYPNGEHVDVFIKPEWRIWGTDYLLSDYGHTSDYLRSALVSPVGTNRKREIVRDITTQLGVTFSEGDLLIEVEGKHVGDLSTYILRLAQACVRVSDMATHQRLRSANGFRDDVEDFLEASGFVAEANVPVRGFLGKDVRMDFRVISPVKPIFINVMAALSETSAHTSSLEIFSRWHDVAKAGDWSASNFVTIYNSDSLSVKEEDLGRLRTYSTVAPYPAEQDYLRSVLSGDTKTEHFHAGA